MSACLRTLCDSRLLEDILNAVACLVSKPRDAGLLQSLPERNKMVTRAILRSELKGVVNCNGTAIQLIRSVPVNKLLPELQNDNSGSTLCRRCLKHTNISRHTVHIQSTRRSGAAERVRA